MYRHVNPACIVASPSTAPADALIAASPLPIDPAAAVTAFTSCDDHERTTQKVKISNMNKWRR
jgi:hypothetical protein